MTRLASLSRNTAGESRTPSVPSSRELDAQDQRAGQQPKRQHLLPALWSPVGLGAAALGMALLGHRLRQSAAARALTVSPRSVRLSEVRAGRERTVWAVETRAVVRCEVHREGDDLAGVTLWTPQRRVTARLLDPVPCQVDLEALLSEAVRSSRRTSGGALRVPEALRTLVDRPRRAASAR